MYYSHFGLSQPPFRITPDTEFFFSGGNRGPILEALIYAIGQGEGIIKVTGEVGSGKTMLCSMLQSRLPANVETVYLANPSVSPDEILHAIALELHLQPPHDAGRLEVMQLLHSHLLERHAQGRQVVMFVEESQSMPIATLEEIRLLSNLETARSKLLQIALFGQPELEDSLRQPQIRQLRERITHSFRLSPLNAGEIREYLNFRLRAAGYRGPDLFSLAIINAIAKASGGLTRRVNLVADKALLAAFAENTHTLSLAHVKAAVRDSEFSHYERPPIQLRLGMPIVLVGLGAGLGIAFYALLQTFVAGGRIVHAPAPSTVERSPPEKPRPATAVDAAPAPADGGTPPKGAMERATRPASPGPPPVTAATSLSVRQSAAPPPTPTKRSSVEVSADSISSPKDDDLLASRMAATKTWLAREDKNTYSIQLLLGADNPEQLKYHLSVIGKFIELNEVFVYSSVARHKPSLTVLYGTFRDRRSALDALAKLPTSLKTYKPYLRTIQGVQAELEQQQRP